MEQLIIFFFILGYAGIAFEHQLKIDKLFPALATMAILWTCVAFGLMYFTTWFDPGSHSLLDISSFDDEQRHHLMESTLVHHLGKTAEILFFLVGAMTIVELIDYFDGFEEFKKYIRAKSKKKLLYIFSFLAFILSAIIDNLTATIVLCTILAKIIDDKETRWYFAGLIVIAANAGGAWSPVGDITTTMLWVGKKVTTRGLVSHVVLPSIVSFFVPVFAASFMPVFKGDIDVVDVKEVKTNKYGARMLCIGILMILFVPAFKSITHLPPYIGMMFALSVVGVLAEVYSRAKLQLSNVGGTVHHSPIHRSLGKIEIPSVLFFLGILLAVAALESVGILFISAQWLNTNIPNTNIVIILLGILSAIIDNVPLVAASMGMFQFPMDDPMWQFIAYAAGTGGSLLIIGSAAGVVAMGLEKIGFGWYLKKISWLALLGYVSGVITLLLTI